MVVLELASKSVCDYYRRKPTLDGFTELRDCYSEYLMIHFDYISVVGVS